MSIANHIQSNFTAGELSPKLDGRVDISKYGNSCRTIENFTVMAYGGLRRRGGSRFVAQAKSTGGGATTALRLIPFQFSTEQTYMLEFGHQYIRFYKDKGRIYDVTKVITGITQANPAQVTSTAHGFSTGNSIYIDSVVGMTQVNGREFIVTVTGANTFTLDGVNSTGYTAYASGGSAKRPYEITTPYSGDSASPNNVWELQYAQSADTMYLVHPQFAPRTLSRTGHTAWTLAIPGFEWGPFQSRKPTATTLTASAITGAGITITASASEFTASHVNSIYLLEEATDTLIDGLWKSATAYVLNDRVQNAGRVYKCTVAGTTGTVAPTHKEGSAVDGGVTWEYQHNGKGYVIITAYTDPTHVTATVVKQLPTSVLTGTKYWAKGAWDVINGYPRTVAFYEERLLFAATPEQPQTIWGSKTGDFADFLLGILAADSFEYTIASDQVNAINWINPGKSLILGTSGGEFVMTGGGAAITPTNVSITRQSAYGSSPVPSIRIANVLLYAQRAKRKIRQMTYDYNSDSFVSPDVTLLSEHVTASGIKDMCYQQEEDSTLWIVLENGRLVACTYLPEQEVIAWHRHFLGKAKTISSVEFYPEVKSAASIPSTTFDHDEMWVLVRRYVNGAYVQYLEIIEEGLESSQTQSQSFYVDSGLSYSGSPATVFSGLDHLEGETVSILADGAVVSDKVVSAGSVTIPLAASIVHVGLPYVSKMQTQRIEAGSQDGTAQGKIKRINHIHARIWRSLNMKAGSNDANLEIVPFRDSYDVMGSPPALFTGDVEIPFPGGYDKDGYIMIVQDQPLPLAILSITAKMRTNG